MKVKNLSRIVCLFLFTVTSCWYANAQTDSSKLSTLTLKDLLSEKVTTASKTLQEIGLAPATVMVVTRDQIKIRGYQSLLDLLYDLPDVKIDDKMYSGLRNSITVRGIQGSEKFMVLLDGISISSPSGEALPIMENYPVHFAEQVEIVFGAASALYGANALSGVINIISKKAPDKKSWIAEASALGGSQGYSNTTLFFSKKLSEDFFFTASGQYSYDKGADHSKVFAGDPLLDISDYATGTFNTIYGPATPVTPVRPAYETPMEAYNIHASLHTNNFSFTLFRNSAKVSTAWGNNTHNAIFNREVFMKQTVSTGTAAFHKSYDKITLSSVLNGSEYTLDPKSNYRNLFTAMEPAYKFSTHFMFRAEQQIDYKHSDKLFLSGGLSYEKHSAIPQSADLSAPVNKNEDIHGTYMGTNAYNRPEGLPATFYFIKYNNVGSFFQTQYSPSVNFHLTLGARYDMNSRYGSSFNPRMGIVFMPSAKTTIKALYGSAFLAPTPSDAYSQYGSFETADSGRSYHSNFLHLPNPFIKPIKTQNIEVNIRHYLRDNLSITLSGYYSILTGLHESSDDNESVGLYNNSFNNIPVDFVEVSINEGRQRTYGGNLQLNLKHSSGKMRFNSYASVSYVGGYTDDPIVTGDEIAKTQLDFISPFMFRAGTDMKMRKFSFAPRLLIMGRQHVSGISDTARAIATRQTLKGYALLNLSARYDMNKRIAVFANVSNALNQRYRNVSFNMDLEKADTELLYGQPQDPIRVFAGFNINF